MNINISKVPDVFFQPAIPVIDLTDMYFNKTATIVKEFLNDPVVTYAVFIRAPCIVALDLACEYLRRNYVGENIVPLTINRLKPEGAQAISGEKLLEFTGNHSVLSALETMFLQRVGFSCVSAWNAYEQCLALPKIPFIDMHARHGTGLDFTICCSYGAAVGSASARLRGATGYIGSSTTVTAPFFGQASGIGTMPHALVGAFKAAGHENPTLSALQAYVKRFPDEAVYTVLVDYDGKEVSDSIACAEWFFNEAKLHEEGKTLAIRLDTHGGRFLEGLDWDKSLLCLQKWTHMSNPDEILDLALKNITPRELINIDLDKIKDRYLFGPGVTVASVVFIRKALDDHDPQFKKVRIVVSSGFNVAKCLIFANLATPINVVGTGSFLPEKTSTAYATADIIRYNGVESVKIGREYLING